MIDSILISTKKALGLAADYTQFDPDIILYVNAVFSTLNQLGIGPDEGFMIEDEELTWKQYLNDDARLNLARIYVVMKVRLLFDPPASAFVLTSMEKQIAESEWRLTVTRDFINGGSLNTNPIVNSGDVVYDDVTFNNATFSGGIISGGTP